MMLTPFFSLPSTAPTIRLLLGLHITAGTVALLAGLVPMLGRKGGPAHVRAGRLYTACMVVVAASAGLLCALQPLTLGRLFLTGIAVLSFYLSFSGWRAARRRSAVLPLPDLVLAALAALVGVGMVGAGIWLQAVLFSFFGALICVFAGLDTWHGLRATAGPVAGPAAWLFRHFTRMGGSYISAFTAFIVVNLGRWLPAGTPSWVGLVGWIAPTLIGTALIFSAVRRYKARLRRPVSGSVIGLVLVLSAALAAPARAQSTVLSGTITDEAGLPLSYASVGVVGQAVGTVADAQGRFQLMLPASVAPTDTLRFALLGYASRSYPVAARPAAVQLATQAIALPDVRVRPHAFDTIRIGNHHYRTNLMTNFALSDQPGLNVGSEIGRVFQIPRRGAWLEKFEFIFAVNDFDSVQVRLNVYRLHHGVPTELLLQKPVYKLITKAGPSRVRIDLHPANLFVEEDVAVTVEWVSHSRRGSRLALPLLMPAFATHLYRYGAANRWKRFPSMSTAMELTVLK